MAYDSTRRIDTGVNASISRVNPPSQLYTLGLGESRRKAVPRQVFPQPGLEYV